jgi:hypothetical protein
MPRPKPNKLHDELDALLDGRPVELTDELAPLVEAADALRAELAALKLDPAVADRHLERVLQGSATVVQLPPRRQANGWDLRRRVAGQAMYPFKLAIEQLRIASVQWSPSREAGERTRVADERLGEVQDLINLKMFNQLPGALGALEKAVVAAQLAVRRAASEGEPVPGVAARLSEVRADGGQVVLRVAVAAAAAGSVDLSEGTRQAIQAAVAETRDVLPPPDPGPGGATPTPTPSAGPTDPGPGPTNPTQPPPGPTSPPTTEAPPPPTSTTPPTTEPPTTEPPTTESTATPGSAGGGDTGVAEWTPAGNVPPTTLDDQGP